MWHRLERGVFIAVFAGLLFAPLIQMAWPLARFQPIEERRELHQVDGFWPRLVRLDDHLPLDINDWFNDHYGFRDLLIRMKNEFDYRAFGTSDRVLVGSDGWLFNLGTYETIRDHSIRAEAPLVQGVKDLNSCLMQRGIKLAVVYNPSKSTIYSEHLPRFKARVHNGLAQRVASELEHEPHLIFVNGERILRAHAGEIVFYKTDMHANARGAQIVYMDLIARMAAAMNIDPPPTARLEPIVGHRVEGSEDRFLGKYWPLVEAVDDFKSTGRLFKEDESGQWTVNTVTDFGEAPSAVFDFVFVNRRRDVPLLPTTVLLGSSFTDQFFTEGFNEAFQAIYRTKNNSIERILPVMSNLPPETKFIIFEYPEHLVTNLEIFAGGNENMQCIFDGARTVIESPTSMQTAPAAYTGARIPEVTWMIARRPIMSFVSFLLYAAAALVAVHEHPSAWTLEHEGSLPAAISHAVYGTQIGIYDSNVRAVFMDLNRTGLTPQSLQHAVDVVNRGDVPAGSTTLGNEGIGAGQPLFMGIAASLFGPYLSSFTILFLLLMGTATLAFIGQFSDDRLFMVPLTFAALSLMLLTPLLSDQEALNEAPIGGNRYFGMLGVLPALHLYFDIREEPTGPSSSRNWLSGVQLVLLVLVILARSSSAYLLGLLILGAFERWRSTRTDRGRRRMFWREGRRLLIVALVAQTIMVATVYDYLLYGRVFGNVWHRAFVSLSIHPEWPFGNLREVYDCTKSMPEGLTRKHNNSNGECVWFAVNRDRPESQLLERVFGPAYEAALRSALFNVIRSYPRQAFDVYFYYKPLMLWQTLKRSLDIEWRAFSVPVVVLVALQMMLFIGSAAHGALAGKPEATWRLGVIPILFVLSLPSQFLAWSLPQTAVDVIFFMYCLIAAALALTIQAALGAIARPAEPGP